MDHQRGHTGICTASDTSVHNIIMVKKIAENIVVTDYVHWFWVSVEAFPEFGERAYIQQVALRHWNVIIPHAIRSVIL